MTSIHSNDQVMSILEQCFPNANQIQIAKISENEMSPNAMISDLINVTLKYHENDVENEKFLVLKVPKQSDATAYLDQLGYYSREAFMYDVLIPRMDTYSDTSIAPFCYKTIDSRIIVLENLTFHDYEKAKENLLHLEQCLPLIEALSDFHASSHKAGQTDPRLFENEILHYSATMEWRSRVATFWEPILVELLARSNECSLIPKLKKICLYLKREDDDFRSKIHYSNFSFLALNHGDLHKENILLKYGSNETIKAVKFVDFQTTYWSTPICDFMNFVIQSCESDLLENHFETLLDRYLQRLNEKLQTTNCSDKYAQPDFLEDIKTLNFCSVLYVMYRAYILYPSDRTQLLEPIFHKNTENSRYYIDLCLNDALFRRHVLNALKLCERLGLLEFSPTDNLKTE